MVSHVIPAVADQSTVREFEERIFRAPDARLVWHEPTSYATPLDRSNLLHAIITWGRLTQSSTLVVGEAVSSAADLTRFMECDELLLAGISARQVRRFNDAQITPDARSSASHELARRRAIPSEGTHRTLVLNNTEPSWNTSPDAMAGAPPSVSTDAGARSLFFRVSLEGTSTDERSMLLGAGETVVTDEFTRDWLVRARWPEAHPLGGSGPFTTLGQRILNPTRPMIDAWERGHPRGSSPADWLGQALWEIFQNTEHHASSTGGTRIDRATRMLLCTRWSKTELMSAPETMSRYVDGVERASGTKVDGYLMVTVLDSGDGLAYTAAARDDVGFLDESDEIAYLKSAVRGTSQSPERPMHGFGMPIVSQLLTDLGGLLRIRSGSLSLSRDFAARPRSANERDDPLDWHFDLDDSARPFRRFGSAVTVVLPSYGDAE
ncbi:MAG: hypothetical protein EPO52_06510 [Herbiconiux sp.]|uniref:hypothetical protein n=1 Tax=Herbiconiux sp. TaxID=1871186 RepID=UPI001201B3CD|nr:hypothetical protein [Herbiconiux sp.]TAJ47850.1 MAG: hypothetical protein EPO52_06510 [Herbiconiux sp.]